MRQKVHAFGKFRFFVLKQKQCHRHIADQKVHLLQFKLKHFFKYAVELISA